MITPTIKLLEEVKQELSELAEYHTNKAEEDMGFFLKLQEIEMKVDTIYKRLVNPITLQEDN